MRYEIATADGGKIEGPISLATGDFTILVADGKPPALHESYKQQAQCVEEIDLPTDGRYFFAAALPPGARWPSLVVELRYRPSQGGFDPGIATTQNHIFIGAGERIFSYEYTDKWQRI